MKGKTRYDENKNGTWLVELNLRRQGMKYKNTRNKKKQLAQQSLLIVISIPFFYEVELSKDINIKKEIISITFYRQQLILLEWF